MTILTILMVSGCYLPRQHTGWTEFSADEAVGLWCGQAGDLLRVTDDNNFLWFQMSADIYESLMDRRDPRDGHSLEYGSTVSASGDWEIWEVGGIMRLRLGFAELNKNSFSFGDELIAVKRKSDGQGVLLYFLSDPDLRVDHEFTRCD